MWKGGHAGNQLDALLKSWSVVFEENKFWLGLTARLDRFIYFILFTYVASNPTLEGLTLFRFEESTSFLFSSHFFSVHVGETHCWREKQSVYLVCKPQRFVSLSTPDWRMSDLNFHPSRFASRSLCDYDLGLAKFRLPCIASSKLYRLHEGRFHFWEISCLTLLNVPKSVSIWVIRNANRTCWKSYFEFPHDRPVVQKGTEASVMDISAFRSTYWPVSSWGRTKTELSVERWKSNYR